MREVAARGRLGLATRIQLAGEIAGAYVRVHWLLRRHDLPTVVAQLREADVAGNGRPDAAAVGVRLGRAVAKTLGHLPGDSRCLTQSLVLLQVLARRRVPATLVIGVTSPSDFQAHAWLEYRDVPLLPPGGAAFEQLLRL